MDTDKRLQKLEEKMLKLDQVLPAWELWLTVFAEQFKLNRSFILSLDKKPETPKAEEPKPEAPTDAPVQS